MKKIMFSLAIISAINLYGCYDMNTLSVKPSTTTVSYGTDCSTAEKDAKIDVLTDTKIIHTKTFHCDDDHPIVWYTFDENNKAICEYCSTQFIYEPDNKKINA